MWIELVMHMSGTRANGERYPPGWTSFQVADWEGEHLVKGGMAREVAPPPAPEPPPVPVQPHKRPLVQQPVQQPVQEIVQEPEPEPGLGAEPPAPGDSKLAWVVYAVSQGADSDTASRMTKADLMSRYGSRL